MSRARKQLRDQLHRGDKMGLDLSQVVKESVEERVHTFNVPTPQGMAQIPIPHSKMKCCPCGCERFVLNYFVTWAKITGMLGAPPITCEAKVFVCAKCGLELAPSHPSVGDGAIVKSSMLDHKE